jgi:hypothetical protein
MDTQPHPDASHPSSHTLGLLMQLAAMVMREVERKSALNDAMCSAAVRPDGFNVTKDRCVERGGWGWVERYGGALIPSDGFNVTKDRRGGEFGVGDGTLSIVMVHPSPNTGVFVVLHSLFMHPSLPLTPRRPYDSFPLPLPVSVWACGLYTYSICYAPGKKM